MSISLREDCVYYSYDEESDSYYCDEQLDEDEMASFLRGKLTACPFYLVATGSPVVFSKASGERADLKLPSSFFPMISE